MTEGGCRPKHSVIFVAFDLEEVGCLGSIFFVRDFLIQQVLQPYGAKLKGAFILDTIMNYNETQFSQTLSPEWQSALPFFWEDLQVIDVINIHRASLKQICLPESTGGKQNRGLFSSSLQKRR
jgi:hypothetical protein